MQTDERRVDETDEAHELKTTEHPFYGPVVERDKTKRPTQPDGVRMTIATSVDQQVSFRMTKTEALDLARELLDQVANLDQTGD